MKIPLFYLRDKQAFTKKEGVLRLEGKPLDLARDLQAQGIRLIHFADLDALSGNSRNFDIFSGLTFFINIQVECAPKEEMITKLLDLKCRIVLPPETPVAKYKEKRLLVAKIPQGYSGSAEGFHDVILENADQTAAKKFEALGKRIIVYEKDKNKVKNAWGIISSS
jgi:hypothetical protein